MRPVYFLIDGTMVKPTENRYCDYLQGSKAPALEDSRREGSPKQYRVLSIGWWDKFYYTVVMKLQGVIEDTYVASRLSEPVNSYLLQWATYERDYEILHTSVLK